ncbi:hypothetical protein ENBRE01_1443 [Enteropsectra breve]|nr:hypothetical protein ENBRE01_1443 [Enteropsectra breve]
MENHEAQTTQIAQLISYAAAYLSSFIGGVNTLSLDLFREMILSFKMPHFDETFKLLNTFFFFGGLFANVLKIICPFPSRYYLYASDILTYLAIIILLSLKTFDLTEPYLLSILLLLARLFIGVSAGIIASTVPVYISSIAPAQHQGKLISLHVVFYIFGLICTSLLGLLNLGIGFSCLAIAIILVISFISKDYRLEPGEPLGSSDISLFKMLRNKKCYRSVMLLFVSNFAQSLSGINHLVLSSHSILRGHSLSPFLFLILMNVVGVGASFLGESEWTDLGVNGRFASPLLQHAVLFICFTWDG